MSLLWMEYETEFENLVDIAFQCEQKANPDYFSKLGSQIKRSFTVIRSIMLTFSTLHMS